MSSASARARLKKRRRSAVEGEIAAKPTKFLGYDFLETEAVVETVLPGEKQDELNVVLDQTPFYAEMGGQVGDHGLLHVPGHDRTKMASCRSSIRKNAAISSFIALQGRRWSRAGTGRSAFASPSMSIDETRFSGHHTVTHLLHWALHEIVSRDATQKGSYVGPDKLTFDFSSAPLTPQQKRDVEKLVNEKIAENAPVSWTEIPYAEAKQRKEIQQFFGEKYGDNVRVLQIGGEPRKLNGYSMELCGGTHVRSTCEIGPFRIVKRGSDRCGHSTNRSGRRRCGAQLGDQEAAAAAGEI